MRGIRREKGIAPHGKAPILLATLRQMVTALPDDRRGLQDKALLLVGFAGAFRRGELVSLTTADIQFVDAGLVIQLRRSKTDQEGVGFSKGLPFATHAETCPVRALPRWLEVAEIVSGPLFRPIDRYGTIGAAALHPQGVVRAVRHAARLIGLDVADLSGHSLRSGLATTAAQAGVSERVIMAQTGHTDVRSVRRYIREGSLFRENAAGLIGL
jgi:integrase